MKDDKTVRLAGIVRESIVDGPGIRFVVFTQGCPHRCEGCHNQSSWDFDGGYECDISKILDEIDKNPLLKGVTFSGGEPFAQSRALGELGKEVKARGLDLIIYTGYRFEKLWEMSIEDEEIRMLMEIADYIVDGKFVESLKSYELRFKGSSNQRIIDAKRSIENGEVVEVEW